MPVKERVKSHERTRDELFLALDDLDNLSCLISDFDDPRFPRGFGRSFFELVMTEAERELMADFCRLVLLPDLASDLERNKLKIAYALCFTDSRKLSVEIRTQLGLTENPPVVRGETNLPRLFDFERPTAWATLCSSAENYLARAHLPLSKGEYDSQISPFKFLGCLMGKNFDYISGVCVETTEFANGVVMVEGVWYFLRGPKSLEGDLKILPGIRGREGVNVLISSRKYGITVDDGLFVLPDCGGVWQPTRFFEPANTDRAHPLMDLL